MELSNHSAVKDVKSCEKIYCAVSFVIIWIGLGKIGLYWTSGLCSLKCLLTQKSELTIHILKSDSKVITD